MCGRYSLEKTDSYGKNRYIAMVAAGCMVLYGYDAAVFNAVQKNDHWLAHFDKPVRGSKTYSRMIC